MNIADLKAFAESDASSPFQLRKLTPQIAAALYEDHLRVLAAEMAKAELFDQYEVNTRNAPIDADFQLARLKRMRAEDEALTATGAMR